jgi:hypothetical protein
VSVDQWWDLFFLVSRLACTGGHSPSTASATLAVEASLTARAGIYWPPVHRHNGGVYNKVEHVEL